MFESLGFCKITVVLLVKSQVHCNILVFRIRWYSDTLSHHWYTSFVCEFDMPLLHLFMWLVVVPFACFALHTVCQYVLLYLKELYLEQLLLMN